MTMNINLTPQLEAMVRTKVTSGLYNSASEVVRDALRLMERDDQVHAATLQQLRQDIQDGLESGSAGPLDIETMKRRGRERLAAPRPPGRPGPDLVGYHQNRPGRRRS